MPRCRALKHDAHYLCEIIRIDTGEIVRSIAWGIDVRDVRRYDVVSFEVVVERRVERSEASEEVGHAA